MSRGARLWLLAAAVFALACGYRFAMVGGRLGGFDNDQFVHLSRAQQIVLGDWPVRDFPEPGLPLTHLMSAAAQYVFGRTLWAEAVLTIGGVALASALLFVLATRASGSIALGLIAALLQVAMAPRLYNYPKVLIYAVAIPLLWRYIDVPSRGRRWAIGAAIAIAFLFRHDHGVYVAVAGVCAVVAAHYRRPPDVVRNTARLAGISLLLVSPYLLFVQAYGGLPAYFRTAAAVAARDAARTDLERPSFTFDHGAPIIAWRPVREYEPAINVRWRDDLTPAARSERERALGLTEIAEVSASTSSYRLNSRTPDRLERIVSDPAVADTHGIDRRAYTLTDPELTRAPGRLERFSDAAARLRIFPGVLRDENAVPFLYYVFLALPVIAMALAARGDGHSAWPAGAAKIVVVAILALAMSYGLLRGSLNARLADVSTVVLLLLAWTIAQALGSRPRPVRWAMRAAVAVTLLLMMASIQTIEAVSDQVGRLTGRQSDRGLAAQTRETMAQLTAVPPAAAWDPGTPGITGLARYLDACTLPSDRVLSLAYRSELFFMAGRGFAGGHVWMMPGFFESEADQRQTLDRMRRTRVPIVVAEREPFYSEDYQPAFPLIDAMLRRDYEDAGEVDLGDSTALRVWTRRGLEPSGEYEPLGLPCFGR